MSTGRLWLSSEMLVHNLTWAALEREVSSQQLIDHDCQSILIGSRDGMASPLFRSHIGGSSANGLARTGIRRDKFRYAKICQHQVGNSLCFPAPNEKVRRLDILMDDLLLMSVLQRVGSLLDNVRNIVGREVVAILPLS
jgi:hypothetical protein